MPLYTYECDACGKQQRIFYGIDAPKPRTVKCVDCGKGSTRRFSPPQLSIFNPYVTTMVTGKPVSIESRGAESEFCRKHQVERVTTDSDPRTLTKPSNTLLRPMSEDFAAVSHVFDQMGVEGRKEAENKYKKTGKVVSV